MKNLKGQEKKLPQYKKRWCSRDSNLFIGSSFVSDVERLNEIYLKESQDGIKDAK